MSCSVVPVSTLFSLTTCVAYVLLILRDLEGIADHLQSLLEQCLLERVTKASRVEEIVKDCVDKVEKALRKYEVWLPRLGTMIRDWLTRGCEF